MRSDTPYFMWSAEARCFVPERSEQTTVPPFSANHSDTPPAPPPTSRQYRLRASTRSSQKRTASNDVATSNWPISARTFRCDCFVTRLAAYAADCRLLLLIARARLRGDVVIRADAGSDPPRVRRDCDRATVSGFAVTSKNDASALGHLRYASPLPSPTP